MFQILFGPPLPPPSPKHVYRKHLFDMFRFLCEVDYGNNKFIHAPTYTYNEVIWLLELIGAI